MIFEPIAKENPIDDLLSLAEQYFQKTKRNITYEYILIEGFNDSLMHAKELVNLVQDQQCSINLIPYNPIKGSLLKRPKTEAIEKFENYLNRYVFVTRRYTKGSDIQAACGQLAFCS